MSNTREYRFTVTDESDDLLEVLSVPFDSELDWTDDTEAILARVKVGGSQHVNIVRADLADLRDFLSEILDLDVKENF